MDKLRLRQQGQFGIGFVGENPRGIGGDVQIGLEDKIEKMKCWHGASERLDLIDAETRNQLRAKIGVHG